MKYLLTVLFIFGGLILKAQGDQSRSGEQPVTCSYIDAGTLSCYSPNVDTDNDGRIDEEEWTNAEVDSRGIIDLDNTYNDEEFSTDNGMYDTKGLYEEEGIYDNRDIEMETYGNEEPYNYNYESLKQKENELDNRQDQLNQSMDYNLYDPDNSVGSP